jgi:hypothetical protein
MVARQKKCCSFLFLPSAQTHPRNGEQCIPVQTGPIATDNSHKFTPFKKERNPIILNQGMKL